MHNITTFEDKHEEVDLVFMYYVTDRSQSCSAFTARERYLAFSTASSAKYSKFLEVTVRFVPQSSLFG